MLNAFNGCKIFIIDKNAGKPVRIHVKKPYMSMSYHLRIQKKWIKRFGLIPYTVPKDQVVFDKNSGAVYMNPAMYEKFKLAAAK